MNNWHLLKSFKKQIISLILLNIIIQNTSGKQCTHPILYVRIQPSTKKEINTFPTPALLRHFLAAILERKPMQCNHVAGINFMWGSGRKFLSNVLDDEARRFLSHWAHSHSWYPTYLSFTIYHPFTPTNPWARTSSQWPFGTIRAGRGGGGGGVMLTWINFF